MSHSSKPPENVSALHSSLPPAHEKTLNNPSSIPPELYERAHNEALSSIPVTTRSSFYIEVMAERLAQVLEEAEFADISRDRIERLLEATRRANEEKGGIEYLLKFPKASRIAFIFQAAKEA